MAWNIIWLADRLHKTPAEIRVGFTREDYDLFMAYVELSKEAQ